MNKNQWNAFCNFRTEFKNKCQEWQKDCESLKQLQIQAAKADTPEYPVENPVVYNTSLDDVFENDEIKLIVIGDNPGKNEQLEKNKKYLVGMAGKIADGFFKRNPALGVDFRKNVIILNKTPVHSAKTNHLKYLVKNGGNQIEQLILQSQIWMAEKTAQLHKALVAFAEDKNQFAKTTIVGENYFAPELWLVGYSELKNNGIFMPYKKSFYNSYFENSVTGNFCEAWKNVKVFQHFSMNRFSIDLNEFISKSEFSSSGGKNNIFQALEDLGTLHRNEIFAM